MRNLQTAVIVTSTVFAGLMAGLFAAFSYAVMPGLGRGSDRSLVESMQGINKAILNPWFMLPFMGTLPLLGAAVWLAWKGHGRAALPWLLAALVLYVVAFFITSGVNVPLNDTLDKAGAVEHIKNLAAVRADYEDKWVHWNTVRAVRHTASFGCLAWALVVFGRKNGS